ncbi:Aminomethyltransferase folate-binding domain-containing protein [Trichocladium antarcticum]|uniref:Iron-sulfur cluster assembly factor IBA57 homolog, mitochondrial n=1 Tax=Trichocladium antarcticum TaxID=1450529 RepID=A0AAN6USU7_9PEZI|nr:Aminomethyltransferase folate-binding domain-containing protein [Trichocladium antarcticum]
MQPARRVLGSAGAAATAVGTKPSGLTCRGCLARQAPPPPLQPQRRAFSRSAPRHAAPPAGPSRAGLAALSSRQLISVAGPDAAKYLQGVVTANLFTGPTPAEQHIRPDPGFYGVFLTAQGRILHDVFIYPDTRPGLPHPAGESFLVEVDAASAALLERHIKRYKLRAKFTVRLLTTITAPDTRAPNHGQRILTFTPTPTPLDFPAAALPLATESAYRLRRYLHGIPEGQAELAHEHALPHESNIDAMGGIDFRKGCYVGQELTIRTEHRGVVRKRVLPWLGSLYRPVVGDAGVTAEMVPAGASIGRVGKKGRSAGKWLSGVGNVGLALCRLEIMTDVVLPGETGGGGFAAGDEFVVGLGREDGQEGEEQKVKIKAFVPDWLRERLAGKEGH